jgi:hypothetical protein
MKPSSWDKQLGLALPLKSAASQSDETNNPSKNEVRYEVGAGCKSPHPHLPEGRGEVFFLDILFHRMGCRWWLLASLAGAFDWLWLVDSVHSFSVSVLRQRIMKERPLPNIEAG